MVEIGDIVKYRTGSSQVPDQQGKVTHIDYLTVYMNGALGRKTGIARPFSEVEPIEKLNQ